MPGPLLRIVTIARVTLTEALRQKVLNVLLVFALVTLGYAFLGSQVTVDAKIKSLKDTGSGAIVIFGMLIAIFSTAQMIPLELDNRTIYTILAKPVRRAEFLLGKFVGVITLVGAAVLLMSLVFAAELLVMEQMLTAEKMVELKDLPASGDDQRHQEELKREIEDITKQTRDPRMLQGLLLIYVKLCIVTAIALLISTFATSSVFTVATTFMLYLIGYLERYAREGWMEDLTPLKSMFLGVISFLIPDFQAYFVIDDIYAGNVIAWSHTWFLVGYGVLYSAVALVIAILTFEGREL